jgi:23S rRNA pseudouridine2457 synthase
METIKLEKTHRHFALHKPFGYLSQFKLVTNKKVKLLGSLYDFPENTMAIGRLDKDSEGLLLLTTDGKTSHFIQSQKVEKEYYVQLDGKITDKALAKLEAGVSLSHESQIYQSLPCIAKRLDQDPRFLPRIKKIRDERHGPTSWASITLREGKFRQVRKMTAVVGFPTLRLVRVRIGGIYLNQLQAGEVLEISDLKNEVINL